MSCNSKLAGNGLPSKSCFHRGTTFLSVPFASDLPSAVTRTCKCHAHIPQRAGVPLHKNAAPGSTCCCSFAKMHIQAKISLPPFCRPETRALLGSQWPSHFNHPRLILPCNIHSWPATAILPPPVWPVDRSSCRSRSDLALASWYGSQHHCHHGP